MSVITACIIAYDAEAKLKDTLTSLKDQVDHIVVGIDSKTTDKTEEVAKSFGAITFPFDLDDDFAGSRQKTFAKAPADTEWFFWIDSDDVFASDIPLHQLADEQAPDVGMVWLPYIYHRDDYGNVTTMFDRERLIRAANSPRWQGRLHETCSVGSGRMNRDKRVWIEHTNRTDDGKGERNFRILRKMIEADPKDHRAVLYLAHQHFAALQWLDACKLYEKFIFLSSPGDVLEEKWQAMIYLAKARRSAGDVDGSLRAAKEALMMCPQYADAYFEIAHDYAQKGDWQRAIHWHEEGLTRKQPDNILILNPLDYSYNPFVVSHHAYFKLNILDKAMIDVRKAVEIRPNEPTLVNSMYHYMWAIERKGAVDSAIGIADHLLDTNEPIKARTILSALPAGVMSTEVEDAKSRVNQRLAHLKDEVEYENFYWGEEDLGNPDNAIEKPFPRGDWTIERLRELGAKKILEVGIGDAGPALRYAKAGFQVVGIDIDPRRVQRGNRTAVRLGYLKTEPRDDLDGLISSNLLRLEDAHKQREFAHEGSNATDEVRADWDAKIAAFEKRDVSLKEELAQSKIIMTPESPVQFHWGSAEEIPQKIKDLGPYDAVILAELMEHVADPEKVLVEADKIAKHVIITTPDGASSYQFFQNKLHPDGNHSGHVRAYSLQDLEAEMLPHGRLVESHVLTDTDFILVGEYAVGEPVIDNPPVVIFCGPGLEEWSPEQIDRQGLGGSETAVVKLAEQLVKKNLRVMVYGPVDGIWNGVYYRHYSKFNPGNPVFAFISWRNPALFDQTINAQLKYLWAHDTDFGDGLTEERGSKVDAVMALSKWHVDHLLTTYPFLADKVFIVGNGIDPTRFNDSFVPDDGPIRPSRIPTRFVYASSPDRGLERALVFWPMIRKEIPDAELHVYYGWENFNKINQGRELQTKIGKLADQPGVEWHGRIGQKELAKELMRSGGMFYPGPHPFNETFCIAALEAQAAGAVPVTRDNGALPETNKYGKVLLNSEATVLDYIEALKYASSLSEADRQEMKTWAQSQTWTAVADRLLANAQTLFSKATTAVAA